MLYGRGELRHCVYRYPLRPGRFHYRVLVGHGLSASAGIRVKDFPCPEHDPSSSGADTGDHPACVGCDIPPASQLRTSQVSCYRAKEVVQPALLTQAHATARVGAAIR